MKKHININDDVLVKYLLEEASDAEQASVHQWVSENEANARYFEHFRLIWEESQRLAPRVMINEDAAWDRFKQKVQHRAPAPVRTERIMSLTWFYRIAAAVIILALGTTVGYFLGHRPNANAVALHTTGQTLTDTLPDGSVVTLNKNSSLTYRVNRKQKIREVQLDGEAFFEIASDAQQPFIIHTSEAAVKVLGTSFNVKTAAGSTEVIVETGRVEVEKASHKIQLEAHEKVTVTNNADAPVKARSTDELYRYYSNHTFVCNGTPLWQLVQALNDAYDVEIIIGNDELRSLPLTTTFSQQPLDSVLSVISDTFDQYHIKIIRNGQHITLQ